jgi:hypothetical protein
LSQLYAQYGPNILRAIIVSRSRGSIMILLALGVLYQSLSRLGYV